MDKDAKSTYARAAIRNSKLPNRNKTIRIRDPKAPQILFLSVIWSPSSNKCGKTKEQNYQQPPAPEAARGGGGKGGYLDEYGINLYSWRATEASTLSSARGQRNRPRHRNPESSHKKPVLHREAGVGRSNRGGRPLAQKIVDGDVPQVADKEVIRLDVVSLVRRANIRGQFEERMQKLMDEIRANKQVITLHR